jgi:hypothetical protein
MSQQERFDRIPHVLHNAIHFYIKAEKLGVKGKVTSKVCKEALEEFAKAYHSGYWKYVTGSPRTTFSNLKENFPESAAKLMELYPKKFGAEKGK